MRIRREIDDAATVIGGTSGYGPQAIGLTPEPEHAQKSEDEGFLVVRHFLFGDDERPLKLLLQKFGEKLVVGSASGDQQGAVPFPEYTHDLSGNVLTIGAQNIRNGQGEGLNARIHLLLHPFSSQ